MDTNRAKKLLDERFQLIYSLLGVQYDETSKWLTHQIVDVLTDAPRHISASVTYKPEPKPELDTEKARELIVKIVDGAFDWGFNLGRGSKYQKDETVAYWDWAKIALQGTNDARTELETMLGIDES